MMKLIESVLFELKEVPGLRFLEPYWYQVQSRRNEAIQKAQETQAKWNKFSHGREALNRAREEVRGKTKKSSSTNASSSTSRNISHVPRNVKGSKKR